MGTCRAITVAIVVVVVGIVLKIAVDIQAWQYFEKVQNHSEYTCRPLYPPKKMVSCEDIELDTTTGRAYLPTSDLTVLFKPRPGSESIIYYVDLPSDTPTPKQMEIVNWPSDTEFVAHGSSFLKFNGEDYFFVINHRAYANWTEAVEVFRIDDTKLIYLYSVTHPLFISVNDIAAITPTSFYITNDHGWGRRGHLMASMVEDALHMAKSNLLFCEKLTNQPSVDCRIVVDGLEMANSVALDRNDRSKVFLTATGHKAVYVYRRDTATNQLFQLQKLVVNTAVDNIVVGADGTVWIAAHPQMMRTMVALMSKGRNKSPSQVLKLTNTTGEYTAKEVYLNDGQEFSMSSVAAVYNGKMLIGPVFGEYVLLCEKKE